MERTIAYCGLVCSECRGFLATQSGDWEALEELAQEMNQAFELGTITADSVACDGCLGDKGKKCGYCAMCAVRRCASERGVTTCADCGAYECDRLKELWRMAPSAQTVLEELRASGTD